MEKSVFDFQEYKRYLTTSIEARPGKGYGFKAELARALSCNSAYVTQVLNKGAHFSLEQAEKINRLLGHSNDEAEYFLLLVQYARAGSTALRDRFKEQMDRLLEKRSFLKTRFDIKTELSEQDQVKYYSAWYYAAVHIATTIPALRTRAAISKALGLSLERVADVLEFLISVGLIKEEKGVLLPGINRIFLGNNSTMISKHHTNWRMKAIESLDRGQSSELHLSTVVSLAQNDIAAIKEQLIKGIERARALVRDSKEEQLHCVNVDFFRIDAP